MFEKIIKSNLQNHLESHNLLSPRLHSFRPKQGTDQAIDKLTALIYTALDQNRKCTSIYLDLKKTIDTVKHN